MKSFFELFHLFNLHSQFYQIYPRSFKDSDDDGIGDIRGIIEKLPYLQETGITATWLSPILKSPQVDYGYDIADFFQVDEIFGTNEDLEELFAEAKKLGIKIIMDFVRKSLNSIVVDKKGLTFPRFPITRLTSMNGSRNQLKGMKSTRIITSGMMVK